MATIPKNLTLTNSAVDILNVIRNNASINYQNYVPQATANAEVIQKIGATILDYPSLQNEFINTLINRIAKVYVTSKTYRNPLAVFKKGILEFGESVEEIFIDLAKIQQFDDETAEKELFKRAKPNVRSAFHVMNYQKFYKVTVSHHQLKQAFLNVDGVVDLIEKIVENVYTSANYDEFLVTKYMLARRIIDGRLKPVEVSSNTTDIKNTVSIIKGISNKFEFMSSDYNTAGVKTSSTKNQQYILMNSNFDAVCDVELLASAFNMSRADFVAQRVLVDGFGDLDNARLAEIFEGDTTYTEIDNDTLTALNTIPCVLVDENYFMIYDELIEMKDTENAQGLYWNYFYHTWKTFSVSPFANAVVFVTVAPTITDVVLTPSTAELATGQTLQLTANVSTTGFAPQTLDFTSDNDNVNVSASGLVTVNDNATGTATITATSTFDNSKTATCTITIN